MTLFIFFWLCLISLPLGVVFLSFRSGAETDSNHLLKIKHILLYRNQREAMEMIQYHNLWVCLFVLYCILCVCVLWIR